MKNYDDTNIWKNNFFTNEFKDEKERLKASFVSFRNNVQVLAKEIQKSMGEYTNHDITHIDALWELADLIIGKDYKLTPTEIYVLGGTFLLHDLGMSIAAYPNGISDIKETEAWPDFVKAAYRDKFNLNPSREEVTAEEIEKIAIVSFLRKNHAKQAEKLATLAWHSRELNTDVFLIEDVEVRQNFGHLIGKIAHSHWWDITLVENAFNRTIGAPSWCPKEWVIDPLKIACILRVADASHIDSSRAPIFARIIRKISGYSDIHWQFQGKIQKPYVSEDTLIYTAASAFTSTETESWWLCMETLQLIDKELRQVDSLLTDKGLMRFKCRGVQGVESVERLTSYIPVEGWYPFDAKVSISDIPNVIKSLGGEELYGRDPKVPIRELIQNAADAIRARKVIEKRDDNYGKIVVKISECDDIKCIEVIDNGIGMSLDVVKHYLLDFGNSYWESELFQEEYPGAYATCNDQVGRYGIGFFSIFMLGSKVKIITRKMTEGQTETLVIEFSDGISHRPIIRKADRNEYIIDGGTQIKIWLNQKELGLFLSDEKKRLNIKNICLEVAPCLDTCLEIQEGDNILTIEKDYWKKSTCDDFTQFLISCNESDRHFEEISLEDEFTKKLSNNITFIVENDGSIVGRGAITSSLRYSTKDYLSGCLTIGGLKACSLTGICGFLEGEALRAARDSAKPIASTEAFKNWSTNQAKLLPDLYDNEKILSHCAQIVRIIGGDCENLPIGIIDNQWVNFNQVIEILKNIQSLIIVDLYFLEYRAKDINKMKLNENILFTNCSGAPVIIQDNNSDRDICFKNIQNKSFQYEFTNLGYIYDAISIAWQIDVDSIIEVCNKEKELVIAVAEGREIKEGGYFLERSNWTPRIIENN